MKKFYLQDTWGSFLYQGSRFDLTHLDEYQFSIEDSEKISRKIAVTFSDHCFTREFIDGADRGLIFAGGSRNQGIFCAERYSYSLRIREHINYAVSGHIMLSEGDNYAIVPTVDKNGSSVLYGILFSLDKASGLPFDLHMRVKSAHLRDTKELITHGKTRFSHLVNLRMKGQRPKKNYGSRRHKP